MKKLRDKSLKFNTVPSCFEILRARRQGTVLLRIIAALAVALAHLNSALGLSGTFGLSIPFDAIANAGLIVFFALSGILLRKSAEDQSAIDFVRRRVSRIYPGFLAVMIVTSFIVLPIAYFREQNTLAGLFVLERRGLFEYFLGILYIPFTSPGQFDEIQINPILPGSLNGSLWTIPLEIQCYAVLCLLANACPIILRHKFVIWLPLVLFIGSVATFSVGYSGYSLTMTLFTSFFAGVAASSAKANFDSSKLWFTILGATIFLAAIGSATQFGIQALSIISPLLICAIISKAKVFERKKITDISFGLYLWHYPTFQVSSWFLTSSNSFEVSLIALAFSVALGSASWRFVESRHLNLKNRLG